MRRVVRVSLYGLAVHALRELVVNGHLGALREIEITDLRTMLRSDVPSRPGWWFSKERGGGLAQALTSHFIDNANWIAGRAPKSIAGIARTANPQRRSLDGGTFATDVADGIFILLDYGDGLVARITTDATVAVPSHVFAVHGERMTAVASGPNQIQTQTFTVDADETNELGLRPSPYAKYAAVNPNVPLFLELLDELAKALDGKPNALPTFEDALATQRVLEAIGYVA